MTDAESADTRLARILHGYAPAQIAHVMARLRLADLLADGPMTVEDLATAARTRPDTLRRLARGLAGLGLVTLDREDWVSLTEMGALLCSGTPGSLRDLALYRGGESYMAWGELEHAVRTGEAAFDAAYGADFFTYFRDHPEAGAAFDGTMTALSLAVIAEAVATYDFGSAQRVLDIGGGRGHFAAAVLLAHPELQGAVFDMPVLVEAADEHLRSRGLAERCLAIGGSFFDSVPEGYDLHILKWILHDWNDQSCRTLLAHSRAALPDDGRLLVVELVLPEGAPGPGPGPLHPAVVMDLTMLVNFGDARERSLDEYRDLLDATGFALERAIALPSRFSILECRPRQEG